jgi:hypothetical protein
MTLVTTSTKRYFVAVRHWFDKTHGNSYYTLRAFDGRTGAYAHTNGMQYGHSESTFAQCAKELLEADDLDLINTIVHVTNVSRMRDL